MFCDVFCFVFCYIKQLQRHIGRTRKRDDFSWRKTEKIGLEKLFLRDRHHVLLLVLSEFEQVNFWRKESMMSGE